MFASMHAVLVDPAVLAVLVSKDVGPVVLLSMPVLRVVDRPVRRHVLQVAVAKVVVQRGEAPKGEASPAVPHVTVLSENGSLVHHVVEVSIASALRVDLSVAVSNVIASIAGSKVVGSSEIDLPVRVAASLSVSVLLALVEANIDTNVLPVGLLALKASVTHAGQGRGGLIAAASLVHRHVIAEATTVSPVRRVVEASMDLHVRHVLHSID